MLLAGIPVERYNLILNKEKVNIMKVTTVIKSNENRWIHEVGEGIHGAGRGISNGFTEV